MSTINFQVRGGQEQGHFSTLFFRSMPRWRYLIWVAVAIVTVAGVLFYFRYQTSLSPMLGGGK
jgi:hypothetical protein